MTIIRAIDLDQLDHLLKGARVERAQISHKVVLLATTVEVEHLSLKQSVMAVR